jgi:hypothetical protein
MVAVVSIPTVHLRDVVGRLRTRPRARPVEVASVNRSTSASRQACATSVVRNGARASHASRNGFFYLRFEQSSGVGLWLWRALPMHSRLDSRLHKNKQGTRSQWGA